MAHSGIIPQKNLEPSILERFFPLGLPPSLQTSIDSLLPSTPVAHNPNPSVKPEPRIIDDEIITGEETQKPTSISSPILSESKPKNPLVDLLAETQNALENTIEALQPETSSTKSKAPKAKAPLPEEKPSTTNNILTPILPTWLNAMIQAPIIAQQELNNSTPQTTQTKNSSPSSSSSTQKSSESNSLWDSISGLWDKGVNFVKKLVTNPVETIKEGFDYLYHNLIEPLTEFLSPDSNRQEKQLEETRKSETQQEEYFANLRETNLRRSEEIAEENRKQQELETNRLEDARTQAAAIEAQWQEERYTTDNNKKKQEEILENIKSLANKFGIDPSALNISENSSLADIKDSILNHAQGREFLEALRDIKGIDLLDADPSLAPRFKNLYLQGWREDLKKLV